MYKNSRQKRQAVFCFSLILFNQSYVLAAPQLYDQKKVKEQQKNHLQLMKDYRTLKEPVAFPDLPVFSGRSKFVNGYLEPNQNGISTCEMEFLAQEDPQTVLSFYKDALAANKWKIWYAGSHSISARHGQGHMCNINVNESRMPKTKSRFTVDYRQIEQQH